MVVLIHVIIALASIAAASYLFFKPSARLMQVSYGLIAGTLVSGTYLVVMSPSHFLQACAAGLAYTAIVTAATIATRVKLVRQQQEI
jgi:multisubunit Na+/H+ antiporter MnhE subunit